MMCDICGNSEIKFLFASRDYVTGDKFFIYKCLKCGIVFTDLRPSGRDFKKYYPDSYYGKRKSFADDLINYSRLRKISGLFGRSKISVLDVGCGNGGFLSLLLRVGYDVQGTEMAPERHFVENAILEKICKKDLPDCGFSEKKFDAVTMWHSLEHIDNPERYLREAKRVLKDEGFLIIEVPNFASWQSRLTGGRWFHLDVPRHLFHYDPKTLPTLLVSYGFPVLKVSHFSFIYGIFGFVQSVINLFTKRNNLLFDILNGKIKPKVSVDFLMTFVLVVPVSFLAIPFVFLESLFKKGAIITVYAKK